VVESVTHFDDTNTEHLVIRSLRMPRHHRRPGRGGAGCGRRHHAGPDAQPAGRFRLAGD
jgi:hypothetical protein